MVRSTTQPRVRLKGREFAFVDPSVADLGVLLRGMRPQIAMSVLSGSEPASREMARVLAQHQEIDVLHIIAHGRPGEVSFAGGALTLAKSRRSSRRSRADRPGSGGRWRDPAVGVRGSRGRHGRGVHRRLGADDRRAGRGFGRTCRCGGARWQLDPRCARKRPAVAAADPRGNRRLCRRAGNLLSHAFHRFSVGWQRGRHFFRHQHRPDPGSRHIRWQRRLRYDPCLQLVRSKH